jgi:hypothetical protein
MRRRSDRWTIDDRCLPQQPVLVDIELPGLRHLWCATRARRIEAEAEAELRAADGEMVGD